MIISLLVSAVMLGVKATSLAAIIRTINRKQELAILIGQLTHLHSGILTDETMERVRHATEFVPAGTEMVCVLQPAP